MQALRSTVDVIRDRLAPISHTSTFRQTGQITPEEFLAAGDYLVYKFPSWSWAAAATPGKSVAYLPRDKQYLVTRGVPCHRRLDGNFAGDGEERIVGEADGDEGWLSTGGGAGVSRGSASGGAREQDVRALGDRGEVEQEEQEEEIPDMEDDDDDDAEAIIPSGAEGGQHSSPLRTYNLYITYTPYYRTPRLYLSGYVRPSPHAASIPLAPEKMLEDIVGDYKDKTVTLEDFPFFDTPVKTASVHPCRHAAVMKVLLDRADAALKLRRERAKAAATAAASSKQTASLERLTDKLSLGGGATSGSGATPGAGAGSGSGVEGYAAGAKAAGSADEWEMLQHDEQEAEAEEAIRVDQYVVVFLKFMASVTPGIEHDFTMGV